jgi:hypothetical protein
MLITFIRRRTSAGKQQKSKCKNRRNRPNFVHIRSDCIPTNSSSFPNCFTSNNCRINKSNSHNQEIHSFELYVLRISRKVLQTNLLYIQMLYIDPDYRRLNVAQELLVRMFLCSARSLGARGCVAELGGRIACCIVSEQQWYVSALPRCWWVQCATPRGSL